MRGLPAEIGSKRYEACDGAFHVKHCRGSARPELGAPAGRPLFILFPPHGPRFCRARGGPPEKTYIYL